MQLKNLFLTFALVAAAAAAPAANPFEVAGAERTNWRIDSSRSEARFTVTKLGFEDVTGVFHESEGTIQHDVDHPQNSRV